MYLTVKCNPLESGQYIYVIPSVVGRHQDAHDIFLRWAERRRRRAGMGLGSSQSCLYTVIYNTQSWQRTCSN